MHRALFGLQYNASDNVWVAIQCIRQCLGCNTMHQTMFGLQYNASDNVWVAIQCIRQCLGCNTMHQTMFGLQYNASDNVWVAIQCIRQCLGCNTMHQTMFVLQYNASCLSLVPFLWHFLQLFLPTRCLNWQLIPQISSPLKYKFMTKIGRSVWLTNDEAF